jgi:hypothetical protein
MFVYTSCERPPACTLEWLTEVALDSTVPVQAFLCAFLKLKPCHDDTDTLLRHISEDLQSPSQRHKLVCVLCLTDRPDDTTRDYVLKMACLSGCRTMVRYLVSEQHFDVTVGALMMVLVSQHYSRDTRIKTIEYLLTNTTDPDITLHMNYWAIKYALFLSEWDVFYLLYRHMYENNVWTPQADVEIRHALPEGHTRDVIKALLAQTRISLNAAAQEIEKHVPLNGPCDLPG